MKTPVHQVRDDPDVPTVDLVLAIVDAACRFRDFDFEEGDPGPALDAIDRAVDAYRARLLARKK